MRYLLLIYEDEAAINPTPEVMARYEAFTKEVQEAGVYLGGEPLPPTSTATTVRVRAGAASNTDGPFAETKEQLGGYYMLDCADLDQALGYAAKIPAAEVGSIEVRPIWEMS